MKRAALFSALSVALLMGCADKSSKTKNSEAPVAAREVPAPEAPKPKAKPPKDSVQARFEAKCIVRCERDRMKEAIGAQVITEGCETGCAARWNTIQVGSIEALSAEKSAKLLGPLVLEKGAATPAIRVGEKAVPVDCAIEGLEAGTVTLAIGTVSQAPLRLTDAICVPHAKPSAKVPSDAEPSGEKPASPKP